MKTRYAYVWMSGLVEFSDKVPDGALLLSKGRTKKWENNITIKCSSSKTKPTYYYIESIARTEDSNEKVDALIAFKDWLDTSNDRKLNKFITEHYNYIDVIQGA